MPRGKSIPTTASRGGAGGALGKNARAGTRRNYVKHKPGEAPRTKKARKTRDGKVKLVQDTSIYSNDVSPSSMPRLELYRHTGIALMQLSRIIPIIRNTKANDMRKQGMAPLLPFPEDRSLPEWDPDKERTIMLKIYRNDGKPLTYPPKLPPPVPIVLEKKEPEEAVIEEPKSTAK